MSYKFRTMLREVFVLNLILCPCVILKQRYTGNLMTGSNLDLEGSLITSLRNDANLDLSMDEEYEDLRAELLAYHTALASLAEDSATSTNMINIATPQPFSTFLESRRSLKTTPCWNMGGICIHYKLCQGHTYFTEIPGCKDKLEVCCLSWNKLEIRDHQDKGISNIIFPWSHHAEIGGRGVLGSKANKIKIKKEHKKPQALQVFDIVKLAKRQENETETNNEKQRLKKHQPNDYRKYDNRQKSHLFLIFNP